MRIVLVFLLFVLTVPANAQTIAGRASVIDGDSLAIHGTRIRLHGIDAPENGQSCVSARHEHYLHPLNLAR